MTGTKKITQRPWFWITTIICGTLVLLSGLFTVLVIFFSALDLFEESATPVSSVSEEVIHEQSSYGEGMYKVGTEIPAGEYKLYAVKAFDEDYGYYEVTATSSGRDEDIIAHRGFDTFIYITVEDGQYLNIYDCYAVPVDPVVDVT